MKTVCCLIQGLVAIYFLLGSVAIGDSQKHQMPDAAEGDPPGMLNSKDSLDTNGLYEQALLLYKQKEYDRTIRLLAELATSHPNEFQINVLFAKALLEKCARLKKYSDDFYQELVYRPYEIGMRLYKDAPGKSEPYYIVAKSLLINNRPEKAERTIRKAIYFASSDHEDYPSYMEVLGDCWMVMMNSDDRAYKEAKQAYKSAIAVETGDPEFRSRIKKRLKKLEKKHAQKGKKSQIKRTKK